MSAVTASLCSTLMFVLFVSADQKNITAVPGQGAGVSGTPINSTNSVDVPPGPTGGRTVEGGKMDRIKEGGGKEDEHVGVAVSAAFLCAALLLVFGVVRFWIKRRIQSKTYDDPEITQPLTSSQEDSYTDDLKIS